MTKGHDSEEFVEQLIAIADDRVRGRAKLAALRRGTSGEERDLARIYPIVLPLSRGSRGYQQACLDTACLFGLHPTTKEQRADAVSLAQALRRLATKSESIEARFQALLQCHREELVGHLRSCIGIVKSNGIALRWVDVLHALRWWNDEANYVSEGRVSQRRRWAHDFWGPQQPEISTSI